MSFTTLMILIYLSGATLAYALIRFLYYLNGKQWTLKHRWVAIGFALPLGPVLAPAMVLFIGVATVCDCVGRLLDVIAWNRRVRW